MNILHRVLAFISLQLTLRFTACDLNNTNFTALNSSAVPVFNISMPYLELQTDKIPSTLSVPRTGDFINYSSPYSVGGMSKWNRTAIILSGQLRSANLTWFSGHIFQNINSRMFGKDDPPSTAATIVEFLFKPLALLHGVDVFMYVTARPETASTYSWDGDPFTFEPRVGDVTACNPFSNNEIFRNTGNRFFCLVEPELQLMTPFIKEFPCWKTYTYGKSEKLKEQVLQQLYGLYRANMASKQYALMTGVGYQYKVRLRPDTAVKSSALSIYIFHTII